MRVRAVKQRKKILITGESGHLGRLLYYALKHSGHCIINDEAHDSVVCFHNKRSLPCVFDYPYDDEIDISNLYEIYSIIEEHKPDIIIHTAAYVGTDKCEEDEFGAYGLNVDAIRHLMSIIKSVAPDCLFVNFSTTATMDPNSYDAVKKISPETPRKPQTWYGETKLMGEVIVKRLSKRWINFLPVFLFGDYPHDTASIWARMFVASLQGKTYEVKLNPEINKQYEYASNVIPLIEKIIMNPKAEGKDIIIAGPEIDCFGAFIYDAEQAFKKQFGALLNYKLKPEDDYLKHHVADYSTMLEYSKVSAKQFVNTRIDFEKAIWLVTESVKNGYKLRK